MDDKPALLASGGTMFRYNLSFAPSANNNSLAPLVELDGQTDDFVLCDVERLHHLARLQLTVLRVEVPPPLHLICERPRGRSALKRSLLSVSSVLTPATLPLNNPGTSL